jgi:hypothetical protein
VRTLLAGLLSIATAFAFSAAPYALAQDMSNRQAIGAGVVAQASDKPASHRRSPHKRSKAVHKPAVTQPAKLIRPAFSKADQDAAQIPGFPDVRFWADSVADFERALPTQKGPWLVLSTGGEEGAYGAGFLNGWAESGSRPQFSVITGVSTGALMATYVFAGPKYDDGLREAYTTINASDVFEVRATPESFTDTWPLADLIKKRVTPEMLAAVAEEYRRGRRLFVTTSNLDAGRTVVWNMGAIAAHGGDAAAELFRKVLLAAASVPVAFPPVYIEAEANGHTFEEMHGDGGVNGPLFFGPEAYLLPGSPKKLPASELYVIFNGKLVPEFYEAERTTSSIYGRMITMALKTGARIELALAQSAAQHAGIGFHLTFVDSSFEQVSRGLFDQAYMNALYALGATQGRKNDRFVNGLPSWTPKPSASGSQSAGSPSAAQ